MCFFLFFFSSLLLYRRISIYLSPPIIISLPLDEQTKLSFDAWGSISSLKKSIITEVKKKSKTTKLTPSSSIGKREREKLLITALFLSLHLSLSVLLDIYKYTRAHTHKRTKKKRPSVTFTSSSLESEVKKERAQSRFYLHVSSDRERENCKEEQRKNHVEWTPSPLEQQRCVFFRALGRLAPAAKRSEESFEADRVYQPTDFMFFGRFGDGGADDFRREMADEFILGRRRRL